MGRISDKFTALKNQGCKALVVYLMGGDPHLEATREMVKHLASLGVDLIEIGVPFSDPLADGPTIQEAGQRALKTTLAQLMELIREIRAEVAIPLLLMSYYNPILNFGVERFAETAAGAGVDGLIVPDMIPEEGGHLMAECKNRGVESILLFTPTSSDERMDYLAKMAGGFIYYVSRTGTTGVHDDLAADLEVNIERIRQRSQVPIAVGFGISTPDQAAQVCRSADGVIIGSAVVKRMAEANGNINQMKADVGQFLSPIIQRLHQTG